MVTQRQSATDFARLTKRRSRSPDIVAREIHALRQQLSELRGELASTAKPASPRVLVDPALRGHQELLRQRHGSFRQKRNVVGVALSEKFTKGRPTGRLGVTVFVSRKRPHRGLPPEHRLPRYLRGSTVRVPVDVVEVGVFERLTFPGASIGPDRIVGTFGSLGCFVLQRGTDRVVALSAMHVGGRDAIDSTAPPIPIFSPDPVHTNSPQPLGGLSFGMSRPVDAGRIDMPAGTPLNNELPGGRMIRGWRPVLLPGDRDTPVMFFGARSGFVTGRIVEPDVQLVMPTAPSDALFATVRSEPGDSGAVLLDQDGYALGVLAGRLTGGPRWSVFSKFGAVLDALDCELPLT